MKILSLILAFVVLVGFAASIPGAAYACSCASSAGESQEERARNAVEGARAVFAGEVVEIDRLSPEIIISSGDSVKVTFDVSRVWKGPARETLRVETARSDASCGYDFDAGKRYLVYAYSATGGDSDVLQVNLCSATTQIEKDTNTLGAVALLGEPGVVPEAGNPDFRGSQLERSLPDTGGASLGVFGVALSAVAILLLIRKWSS